MWRISQSISISETELQFDYISSSGPGGQNVNKVATAVRLSFNVIQSPSLPDRVKDRLWIVANGKIASDGTLTILARRYRTQDRNRVDAIDRFIRLIDKAAIQPKKRILTHASAAVKEKRMKMKRILGDRKKLRKPLSFNDM